MARKKKIQETKELPVEINPSEASVVISALTDLKNHPGWIFVKKILEENIFNQEKKILNTLFDKELKYNEEDLEKQIRRVYIDISGLPDREIARLNGNEAAVEEYDPYYKDVKDIR